MTAQPRFDPEVAALLDEIAADPDSNLIRPLRPREWRDVPGITTPITPTAPDLTKAERHFVQVYREEAAALLVQAGQYQLLERSCLGPYITTNVTVDWTYSATPPNKKAKGLTNNRGIPREHQELLRSMARGDSPSALDLLVAATRLAPSPSRHNWIALALAESGQLRSAELALRESLLRNPSDLMLSYTYTNLGFVCFLMGRHEEALRMYTRGSKARVSRPTPIAHWFAMACSLEKPDSAREAAKLLDDMVPPEHPSIEQKVRSLRMTWKGSRSMAGFVSRIADRIGPASMRIASALS